MDVILDGQPITQDISGNNLQEMLQVISDYFMSPDLSLREVLINGQPYEEATMGSPLSISREGISRLEIQTVSAREMALHFLTSANPTLEALIQAAPAVAEMLRAGETQQANEKYLHLLNTLQLFLQMVEKSSNVLGVDVDGSRLEEVSSRRSFDRLSNLIGQLLESQDQEDWLTLADILEYDLSPELESWQKLLPLIAQETSK